MIAFLDLKAMNTQYANELKEATARIVDIVWDVDESFDTSYLMVSGKI